MKLESGQRMRALLDAWLPECFGYHLALLSEHLRATDLAASKIKHRFVCRARYNPSLDTDLVANATALAFATDSIDLLILDRQLENTTDPLLILTEAERVLISHGQVILIGINPYAFQRLGNYLGRHKRLARQHKHYYSVAQIKRLLIPTPFCLEAIQPLHAQATSAWKGFLIKWHLWPSNLYALRLAKKKPCLIALRATHRPLPHTQGQTVLPRQWINDEPTVRPTNYSHPGESVPDPAKSHP